MIEKFLKAKHWQLFILTFGILMVIQISMMAVLITNGVKKHPDPLLVLNYMKFFPIMMLLFIGAHFGWLWSIAIGLQSKIPENVKMKVKKFKIFFFIPLFYIAAVLIFISTAFAGIMENGPEANLAILISAMALILPMHFFSMFCILYTLYFVAKTYKTVELQREVSFSDFAGEFFLIWFFPIGVWIIQPKINVMAQN